jgi:hypothetical protein
MPIQIIDNFDLNSAKPIDNRFVVGPNSFYIDKDLIPYKYAGMRIWDLNIGAYGTPYVWTGSTYSAEISSSVSGGGSASYVPKFNSSNSIINSNIYDNGSEICIKTTTPLSGYTLTVNGGISSLGVLGFNGVGTLLTNLNASNVTSGVLSLNRLQNSISPNYILTSGSGGSGGSVFVDPNTLTVGAASTLSTSRTIWGQDFNGSSNISGNIVGAGTIQFGSTLNKATLNYTGLATLNLVVPSNVYFVPITRTLALLEDNQIYTGVNTYSGNNIHSGNNSFTGINSFSNVTSVVISGNQKMKINQDVYFGLETTGYPMIRTSNSPSASLPSFTWSGDISTGLYRPSSGVVGFSTNGTERMRISDNGVSIGSSISIGSSGTNIKKMVVGRLEITINGSVDPVIKAGSGFTAVAMSGYTGASLRVRVSVTGGFGVGSGTNPNGVVVIANGISDTANSYFYCPSWTNNDFEIRCGGAGSGTVQVNFVAYSVY